MKPPLHVLLCSPRGFCAGVERAIAMVEAALAKHGAPVYVRHEIVHNRTVVGRLEAKGTIFVEELDEIPANTPHPVIFSAHGVSRAVVEDARSRGFAVIDATCPLVSKVHHEAALHAANGHHILVIGHAGHPEILGTMGHIPTGQCTLIQTLEDARSVTPPNQPLALVTQTTLSVDETSGIIAELTRRFPHLKQPKKEDICYATTNRQTAIKSVAPRADMVLVVGAPNSSNSRQLVATALAHGASAAHLIGRAEDLSALDFTNVQTLGLSAGASAPEDLVQGVITHLQATRTTTVEEVITAVEDITFKIPQSLSQPTA
ncbi:MAG: 4-hydroxy-3-methylbut-2-enyl diphosphate reductase [Proteobacteria bacterium]|nr:4-hydroxy-3-methylbut-2-enyl diphosphate reductase [Pseudomonadota bacterium]